MTENEYILKISESDLKMIAGMLNSEVYWHRMAMEQDMLLKQAKDTIESLTDALKKYERLIK